MARNGQGHQDPDDLRKEAAELRAAMRQTATELKDRIRDKTHQVTEVVERTRGKVEDVTEVVERTRERMEDVDGAVHRYRYHLIGGAVAAGAVIGFRRRRRRKVYRARNMEQAVRFVIEHPREKSSLLRTLAGAIGALALRSAVRYLEDRFGGGELEEPQPPAFRQRRYPLPSTRPRFD